MFPHASRSQEHRFPETLRVARRFTGGLTLALAATLCGGLGAGLVSCSSTPDTGEDGRPKLSDEEQLGLYFENALRYIELGDIARAEDQAFRALEIEPKNSRFLLIYGQCKLLQGKSGDIQAAIQIFESISEKDDYRVQMFWGAAVERSGVLYEEAAAGVRDGSRPTDAPDRAKRSVELESEARDQWRQAKAHFLRSREIYPGEPQSLGGLVRTTALLGEMDESIAYARELIDSIRGSQRLVMIQLEDEGLSAEDETRLFENKRSNREFEVKARLHIAFLLEELGRYNEAVTEFDEILVLQPDLPEAYSLKAQLLFDLGEFVKARSSIERFIELRARTASFEDPDIRKAYDFVERCERAIATSNQN
jgi:tetratricopeptide (TPR) repeat protein